MVCGFECGNYDSGCGAALRPGSRGGPAPPNPDRLAARLHVFAANWRQKLYSRLTPCRSFGRAPLSALKRAVRRGRLRAALLGASFAAPIPSGTVAPDRRSGPCALTSRQWCGGRAITVDLCRVHIHGTPAVGGAPRTAVWHAISPCPLRPLSSFYHAHTSPTGIRSRGAGSCDAAGVAWRARSPPHSPPPQLTSSI